MVAVVTCTGTAHVQAQLFFIMDRGGGPKHPLPPTPRICRQSVLPGRAFSPVVQPFFHKQPFAPKLMGSQDKRDRQVENSRGPVGKRVSRRKAWSLNLAIAYIGETFLISRRS